MPPSSVMTRNSASHTMSRSFLLLSLLVYLPAAFADDSQHEAYNWLEKMHSAVQQLNYAGTFVHLHNQNMETMRIVHTVEDGVERERLVSLNGVQREVVRSKGEVICIQPDLKSVLVGKRVGHGAITNIVPYDPNEIAAYYEFKIGSEERIADRKAKIIYVIPKDEDRYGHRVSLDTETALPLRSDILDNSGNPISQIMFTSIKTGPEVRDNALELVTQDELKEYNWKHQIPMVNMATTDESGKWEFGPYPDGFRLSVHEGRPGNKDGDTVEHFVFTDGLATMSVYIEKSMAGKRFEGGSQMGAIHAYGTQVGDFQVTAVGEVPAQTVKKFALSAKYKQE